MTPTPDPESDPDPDALTARASESEADAAPDLDPEFETAIRQVVRDELDQATTDDSNGWPAVSRREALQAGGVLGLGALLGGGGATALTGRASADAQGQFGTQADPLQQIYVDQLYGVEQDVNLASPLWLAQTGGAFFHTFFESLDGFTAPTTGSASTSASGFFAEIDTGTTANSTGMIEKGPNYSIRTFRTWDKSRYMATKVEFLDSIGSRRDYISSGRIQDGNPGIGFKLNSSGELVGVVHDGNSETTTSLLPNISLGTYTLEYHFERLVETPTVVTFYVDETQEGTISSGYPTGTSASGKSLQYHLENLSGSTRRIRMSERREALASQGI